MRPVDTFAQVIKGWKALIMNENKLLRDLRMDDCNNCESKKKTPIGSFCKECGCYLEAKTRCFNCDCPLDKWMIK